MRLLFLFLFGYDYQEQGVFLSEEVLNFEF